MALPSSGAITHAMIQQEFGGSNPIGLNEYYGVATGVPTSGTISNSDFYGTQAVKETLITCGQPFNVSLATRKGYGQANKTAFFHPESAQGFEAFGSSSVVSGVVGGYDLLGIHAGTYTDNNEKFVVITASNPNGTNPNWSVLKTKWPSQSTWISLPRSSNSGWGANLHGYGIIYFRVSNNVLGDPIRDTWYNFNSGTQVQVRFE